MKSLNTSKLITNKTDAAFLASLQNEISKVLGWEIKLDPRRSIDPGVNLVIEEKGIPAYTIMELPLDRFLNPDGILKNRDELRAVVEMLWIDFCDSWKNRYQRSSELCIRLGVISDPDLNRVTVDEGDLAFLYSILDILTKYLG